MLHLQKYLCSFPSIAEGIEHLKEEYSIRVKEYDNLYCFKYNQIDSIKNNSIVMECRGIILDKTGKVVCRPFDRFFNYGEEGTLDFNFNDSICLEKLDGSILKVYFDEYNNEWKVGTSGTAFAEGENALGKMFKTLVEETIECSIHEMMVKLEFHPSFTFLFELVSPENRIVKKYKENALYLLGVRNKYDGEYQNYNALKNIVEEFKEFEFDMVKLPKKYTLIDFDSVKKSYAELGSDDEGYVFWNEKTGERVKCKTPQYLKLFRMKLNIMVKKELINTVINNEIDEVLVYFPEYSDILKKMKTEYNDLILGIETTFNNIKNLDKKSFAIKINKLIISKLLFEMKSKYDKNIEFNIKEMILSSNVSYLIKLFS